MQIGQQASSVVLLPLDNTFSLAQPPGRATILRNLAAPTTATPIETSSLGWQENYRFNGRSEGGRDTPSIVLGNWLEGQKINFS